MSFIKWYLETLDTFPRLEIVTRDREPVEKPKAKRTTTLATPKSKHKKGPARIRLSLSRPFSEAEKEFISSLRGSDSWTYRLRLSKSGRLYAESRQYDSRALFTIVNTFLEDMFVNVFPTAVRTFRELER